MPVIGSITINGVKYDIQDFRINWLNNLEPVWFNSEPTIRFYNPYEETEEQRDKRLNPRKYDLCKHCDHYRHKHQLGYGKCNDVDIDYDYDYKMEDKCGCKEFV